MSIGTWSEQAACLGAPPETFLPWPPGQPPHEQNPALAAPAKAICATCTVKTDCLNDPLTADDRHSIRGGLTPTERNPTETHTCPDCNRTFRSPQGLTMHAAAAHGHQAACGTVPGYQRHRRRHEPPCTECRAAQTADQRNRRAQQRGAA